MPVRLEFFGIPRQRAGASELWIEAATLGEALRLACHELPGLSECLAPDASLGPGYLANINGNLFTRDLTKVLSSGDEVLILSADVGG